MNVLKFTLSGKTAFFKKPDVNSNFYFTYGHIHKVALLGIFGATIGYGGYNQQIRNSSMAYPEFYDKLSDIKIGIVPELSNNKEEFKNIVPNKNKIQKGYFNKKIQTFNNTVGYANADGNLIVKEQWLEDPCWSIYLMLKSDVEKEIAEHILGSKTAFIPYLGKNDHMAVISNAEIIRMENCPLTHGFRMDSLYLKECFRTFLEEDDELLDLDEEIEVTFKYEERLPIALEKTTNQYITTTFIYTNGKVVIKDSDDIKNIVVGRCNEKIIQFY